MQAQDKTSFSVNNYAFDIILEFLKQNKGLVTATFLLQLITSLFEFTILPLHISKTVSDRTNLPHNLIYLFILYVVLKIISIGNVHTHTILEPKLYEFVTMKVVRKLLNDTQTTPPDLATSIDNISIFRNALHDYSLILFATVVPRMIVLVVNCIALFTIHKGFGALVLFLLSAHYTYVFSTLDKCNDTVQKTNESRDAFHVYLEDVLLNIHILKTTAGSFEKELSKMEAQVKDWKHANTEMLQCVSSQQFVNSATSVGFLILIFITMYMLTKSLTFEETTRCILLITGMFANIADVSFYLPELAQRIALLHASSKYLNQTSDKTTVDENFTTTKPQVISTLPEAISLQNVLYSYSTSSSPILNDFNLVIPKERITAIFGSSGRGKTTIAKLICGHITPQEGLITVCTDNILYVDQNSSSLFNRSVEENVLYGLEGEDKEKALSKCKELIRKYQLFDGDITFLERRCGKMGTELSGGQKKVIYLLKAAVNPGQEKDKGKIIILDEPLNGLDPVLSDHVLQLIDYLRDIELHTIIDIDFDIKQYKKKSFLRKIFGC